MLNLVWIVLVMVLVITDAHSNESRLVEDLLDNYPNWKSARPVLNDSDVVVVTFSFVLTEVVNLDEKLQSITVNGWMTESWQDQLMVWNASDYGGIDIIKVPLNSIWIPDITLYNNVDKGFERTRTDLPLSITSKGVVFMTTPAIYTAFCKLNVKYFPFDKQVCYFLFGSWTYFSHQVDMKITRTEEEINYDYFIENGVWDIEYLKFKNKKTVYAWDPHPYTNVYMTIGLRRRSKFYVRNILVPCILLSFLAVFVFILPPECGEKISFSITNLLAIVLFQQLISETLPPSDDSPIIANFIKLIVALGCISVMATSIILKFHFGRHGKPVNKFIYRIFVRGLGSVLRVYEPDSERQRMHSKQVELVYYRPKMIAVISDNEESMSPHQGSTETKEMADIRKSNQQSNEQKKEEELTKTWMDLAHVFDRLMLIICLLIFVITSVVIAVMMLENKP
ncbi:neuronal acetylcholine receptor subunit beta-3-like [Anneissia japonica]|uniref:neuronal acetylcholine receptor subunit beta-3-like n=1 Tax=Anneissia japonica TaxID=1529436 RepID=UPI0014257B05|nr:neuronal acetylcholine receptor subunit beta-3-like [Anneissia japonica]